MWFYLFVLPFLSRWSCCCCWPSLPFVSCIASGWQNWDGKGGNIKSNKQTDHWELYLLSEPRLSFLSVGCMSLMFEPEILRSQNRTHSLCVFALPLLCPLSLFLPALLGLSPSWNYGNCRPNCRLQPDSLDSLTARCLSLDFNLSQTQPEPDNSSVLYSSIPLCSSCDKNTQRMPMKDTAPFPTESGLSQWGDTLVVCRISLKFSALSEPSFPQCMLN